MASRTRNKEKHETDAQSILESDETANTESLHGPVPANAHHRLSNMAKYLGLGSKTGVQD